MGLCFFSFIYKYEKALFSAKRIPSPDGSDLLIKVEIHVAQHLNNLSFGWLCEEYHLIEQWAAFQGEYPKHTMLGSVPRMIFEAQKTGSVQLTKWRAKQYSLLFKSTYQEPQQTCLILKLDITRKSRSMRLKYPVNSIFQITLLMWQWQGWGNKLGPQTIPYPVLTQVYPSCLSITMQNCSAFQKVRQARISRSCLTLASGPSVVSQLVSSLKKEKEVGWLVREGRGKGKRRQ